jgi:hypothetical protein
VIGVRDEPGRDDDAEHEQTGSPQVTPRAAVIPGTA